MRLGRCLSMELPLVALTLLCAAAAVVERHEIDDTSRRESQYSFSSSNTDLSNSIAAAPEVLHLTPFSPNSGTTSTTWKRAEEFLEPTDEKLAYLKRMYDLYNPLTRTNVKFNPITYSRARRVIKREALVTSTSSPSSKDAGSSPKPPSQELLEAVKLYRDTQRHIEILAYSEQMAHDNGWRNYEDFFRIRKEIFQRGIKLPQKFVDAITKIELPKVRLAIENYRF